MSRGRPRINDSWLYDEETVRVGVLLFRERPCAGCGASLPACTDYYSLSKNGDGFAHLKSACKRCTASRYREADKQRRQRMRNEAKAASLVHGLCARVAEKVGERGVNRLPRGHTFQRKVVRCG